MRVNSAFNGFFNIRVCKSFLYSAATQGKSGGKDRSSNVIMC
jgi:hypothetical protein